MAHLVSWLRSSRASVHSRQYSCVLCSCADATLHCPDSLRPLLACCTGAFCAVETEQSNAFLRRCRLVVSQIDTAQETGKTLVHRDSTLLANEHSCVCYTTNRLCVVETCCLDCYFVPSNNHLSLYCICHRYS